MRSLALILATLIYITTAHAQVIIPPATTNAVETDPIWSAASNLYATTAGVAAAYLPLSGGTMAGDIDMNSLQVTSVDKLKFTFGAEFVDDSPGSNLTFRGKMNGLVLSDGLSFSSQQSKIAHAEGGSPYIEINNDVIYYGGIHELATNATVRVYGKSQITDIDELVVSNSNLGVISLSDSSSKGALIGSSGSVGTVYIKPADTNEIIGIRGGRLVIRNASDAVAFIIAPDGIYDENGNQIFNPSGRIRQSINESSTFGSVTAQTVTANSFTGSFTGNGASITNLTLTGYVQANTLSSYVTITAGNTNYARRTTVPASNTAFGAYNQWALDNTNLYFYNSASSKWLKVNGTLEW